MPLYEYRCQECEGREEHVSPLGSKYNGACTRCGGKLVSVMAPCHIRMAQPFYVLDGKGNVLDRKPDSESVEPPTPPERAHWLKGHANRVEV